MSGSNLYFGLGKTIFDLVFKAEFSFGRNHCIMGGVLHSLPVLFSLVYLIAIYINSITKMIGPTLIKLYRILYVNI